MQKIIQTFIIDQNQKELTTKGKKIFSKKSKSVTHNFM